MAQGRLIENAKKRWGTFERFFKPSRGVPSCAGISGGRTSGLMAALLDPEIHLTFQNTGREHPKTLDFLRNLEESLGRKITWLEFRAPKKKGAPPRDFEFAEVSYATADRSGGPFESFMASIADYRATKGEEAISPWARQRICTAYMKQKVKDRWAKRNGWDSFDTFLGLRYDEPARVNRIKDLCTDRYDFSAPLSDARITKADVLQFWSEQSFDLDLLDRQGNCTACFLKDQSDLSRVLQEPETEADWWIRMEKTYRNFGGSRFAGYEVLRNEGPMRIKIEQDLRRGAAPVNPGVEDRRFKLVVLQETRRLKGELESFSCSCEQSMAQGLQEELDF